MIHWIGIRLGAAAVIVLFVALVLNELGVWVWL